MRYEAHTLLALVHFVSAIVVDTLITVATAFHLHNQKSLVARSLVYMLLYVTIAFGNANETTNRTSEMLSRLIRMVWQSALPPTICVIANATLLQIHATQNTCVSALFSSLLSLMLYPADTLLSTWSCASCTLSHSCIRST
jgi:hypothetical protein